MAGSEYTDTLEAGEQRPEQSLISTTGRVEFNSRGLQVTLGTGSMTPGVVTHKIKLMVKRVSDFQQNELEIKEVPIFLRC